MKNLGRSLVLILVLAAFTIMAWGSGSNSPNEAKTPSSVISAEPGAGSKSSESTSAPVSTASAASTSTPDKTPAPAKATIEEAVLFEQDGIRITAKSLNYSGLFGPEVKLLIENNSSQSITVQTRNASVNGYMIETMMSADVAAGKKANDSITLMKSDLDAADIKTIADIEFRFHIFDSSSWDTLYDSDVIRIETSEADGYAYTFDDSGDSVYTGNGVEIVVKGLAEDSSIFGPSIVVYISNTSNKDITVQVKDVSVNGFMIDTMFSCDVLVGKHAIDTITFMSSDLEENEIKSIQNIELSFHVFNSDSWDTIMDTTPVTINFD